MVTLPVLVYSLGYLKGGYSPTRVWTGQCITAAFVVFMALVVSVKNAFAFLVFWELMSWSSYFLVVFDHEHERSVQAGTIYIVMTHIGTACLVAAFLILYKAAGSFDFAAIQVAARAMPELERARLFLLFFFGFATKAGVVPMHLWLPYAHPQAPSHISSIMSAVMIKTAVYGILRFIVFIMGSSTAWWGIMVMVFGGLSALVGIIYALMEKDIKRFLAYSSVENMGIILFGLGAGMLFWALELPVLAVLAFCAGLYHLINHAVFKGLLFMSAGSVYKSCGLRDMEKMGGLIRSMPWNAAFFLVGAMSIAALPPFNGFVSEWLTLQVFFLGALSVAAPGIKIFLGICAAILLLTGALAAAGFVKTFGITFLGLPRGEYAQAPKDASLSMKLGMGFLAALSLLLGLFAPAVTRLLAKVAGCVFNTDVSTMRFGLNNFILSPDPGAGIYLSTPLLAGVIVLALLLPAAAVYLLAGRRKVKIGDTWDCGYYKIGARNEYSATAFSKPFRIAFSFFLLPYHRTQKIRESFYHVKTFLYETHTTPVFNKFLYGVILKWIFRSAHFMKKIQPGSIHLYIGYIFLTTILLIIFIGRF